MAGRTEEQNTYSPDNRLSLEQQTAMALRIMDREGVSERRAFQIIGETQAARQKILDERAAAQGKRWDKATQSYQPFKPAVQD